MGLVRHDDDAVIVFGFVGFVGNDVVSGIAHFFWIDWTCFYLTIGFYFWVEVE